MAKLPTAISDTMPTPTPQRRVQGYESQAVPNALYQAGQAMEQDAAKIQAKVDRDAVLEAQKRANEARRQVMDTLYGDGKTEGLYSAQGSAAMGTEDRFSKRWKEIRDSAMNGVTNPTAQKALGQDLDNLELSHLDNVKRFEMGQRKAYTTELTAAQSALDAERAGTEFNNQKTIDDLLISAEKTGTTAAKLKGAKPGDAIWRTEITNAKSGVLSSQLLAMSRSKDPAVLLDFSNKYEKYRQSGALTLDAVEKFDAIQAQLAPQINAQRALGQIYGEQVAFRAPPKKLVDAVMATESGGDHSAVSPKGARGLMQITPDTALHLAGGNKGVADEILKNPEINRVAGEKYLGDLVKQFGDERMALMAYNAGPTIVSDWMNGTNKSGKNESGLKIGDPSKGEVTVDEFITRVPFKETREYVGKVLKSAGYAGRHGTIDMDVATAYAASMDEKSGEAFLKLVKQNNEAFAAQTKADVNGTAGVILDTLAQSGGDWSKVPPDVIAHAQENGAWNAVKDYDVKKPSNNAVSAYLYSLDAKGLQEADLSSPDIRGGLSPDDYKRWVKKKEALTSSSLAVTTDLRKGMVDRALAARGLKAGGSGDEGDENRARVVRINNLIDLDVDAFAQANNGRMPGPSEMQKIVDNVFIDQKQDINPGIFRWGKDRYVYDVTLDDIPKDEIKRIRRELNDKGIADTDARIIETYFMNPEIRSELRKEVEGAADTIKAIPGALGSLYDKTAAAAKYVKESSAARSVGDYLTLYGNMGTDPRDLTPEQKAAIKRITGRE